MFSFPPIGSGTLQVITNLLEYNDIISLIQSIRSDCSRFEVDDETGDQKSSSDG